MDKAEAARKARERRAARKAAGMCLACATPTENGRTYCRACLDTFRRTSGPLENAKLIDLTGLVVGRLTVVSFARFTRRPSDGHRQSMWRCRCECGNELEVPNGNLRSENTRSCGCLERELLSARSRTHGKSKTKTYESWLNMHARCKPGHVRSDDYAGRGITVCERWNQFAAFLEDMGERPKGTTLDRIDNNRGYEPGNCRWTTYLVQARNSRKNHLVTIQGETLPISMWAERTGIPDRVLWRRLNLGWSPDQLLLPRQHRWTGRSRM